MAGIKFDFIFGCRSPASKYARDGAFMVYKVRGCPEIRAAVFEDGMDFLATVPDAMEEYNKFASRGWRPMSVDDLVHTAIDHDQIDDTTILSPDCM